MSEMFSLDLTDEPTPHNPSVDGDEDRDESEPDEFHTPTVSVRQPLEHVPPAADSAQQSVSAVRHPAHLTADISESAA